MKNGEQKKNDANRGSQEERLQYECEQAFLRRTYTEPSVEEEWKRFQRELPRDVAPAQQSSRTTAFRYWLYGAASVAAVVVALFLWMRGGATESDDTLTLFAAPVEELSVTLEEQLAETGETCRTEIAPQTSSRAIRNGAVITPRQADYTHLTTDRVTTTTLYIPCGQVYKVILNDGTEVWLNANSRLIYPVRFAGNKRKVRLEGEAYFKVARNERMPFVIETETLTTEVLGTEFNVKSYKESQTHVTLVNGSVRVGMPSLGKTVILEPGEEITYAEKGYQVKKVDTAYYTQWREGYFYFDDFYLSDILKDLGRWYNVTIAMEKDSLLLNQKLHFVAERNEDIDQVIENLNAFSYLSASKQGNKVMIKRKK